MEGENFEAIWYRALTLTERIASLGAGKTLVQNGFDAKLSDRRWQRWRSQYPLTNPTYFAQRLALDKISESEFRYLLGEPIKGLAKRHIGNLVWLQELKQVFVSSDESSLKNIWPNKGFLCAIAPLIDRGFKYLYPEIKKLDKLPISDDDSIIESILLAFLPDRLFWMFDRTMMLECNVAHLQGLLSGETPQERFDNFQKRLQNPETCISLLQEYPVLARQLVICIDRWVEVSLEFIKRLRADWSVICSELNNGIEPGFLVEINNNIGDSHNGGRTVVIAKFSSGFQVVYKPKPLAVDLHFQELLSWINATHNSELFLTLKILDRGTYGWVEFLQAKSCENSKQIAQFYQRLGGYLALLYAIEGTDFHAENIIAAGEHPILIDLESLFHPRPNAPDSPNAVLPARQRMSKSVLRVGLLPKRQLANREERGFDVSAIGGNSAEFSQAKKSGLADLGTEKMQNIGDNQPRLNGEPVNVLDYCGAIADGFTAIYRLIVRHRDEFCEFLNRFANDEVRVILRETRSYGLLLRESFHPDVLRDALDRDRLFDRLWVEVPTFPYLEVAINAEKTALGQGDIPKFLTRPNSRNLWLENGECIPDFFEETGLKSVRNRLQQFSEADLAQQLWFIRTSLTAMSMVAQPKKSPTYAVPPTLQIPDRNTANAAYLQAAIAVGDRLESLAICHDGFAGWIAPVFAGTNRWTVHALGWDLFDGMPGIAMFLAYLGAIAADNRYTKLARSALRSLLHQVNYEGYLITSVGAFNGWAGLIYTLTHLGKLWEQPELISQAVVWAQKLPHLIEKDEQLDIIGGAAGCIHVLTGLYQYVPDDSLKSAAIKCGDRLLKTARTMQQGIGWITLPECKPLTGFSHGAAGIARALFELAAFSGEQRFREAAIGAIAYERSLFSQQMKNWPDLRIELENQILFGLGWSHGAPGIGMARLHSLKYFEDAEIRAEIETAMKTALADGFGYNHSLCNGDLGNLEFLDDCREMLNICQASDVCKIAAGVLTSIEKNGWICDVPMEVENLGLMTGLAGIGYGFLRRAARDRVPSMLLLSPPL